MMADPLAGPRPGDPWFPFSEASLGDRGKRFYLVARELECILPPDLMVAQRLNDALEWALEIGHRDITQVDQALVWVSSMIDEPVWGYDLEARLGGGPAWDVVKSESLDLPEASVPTVVAQAFLEAIERDRVAFGAEGAST
jgi:hypothetical protein